VPRQTTTSGVARVASAASCAFEKTSAAQPRAIASSSKSRLAVWNASSTSAAPASRNGRREEASPTPKTPWLAPISQ
jgi:hypothetical protein